MCEETAGQRSSVERGCSPSAHGLWGVRAWESEPRASICFSLTLWALEWHRADPTPVAQLCQGSACSSKQRKALTVTLPSCPHEPHHCCFSVFVYIPPTSTISWCWTQGTQQDSIESYKKEEGNKERKGIMKQGGKEKGKEEGRKRERDDRCSWVAWTLDRDPGPSQGHPPPSHPRFVQRPVGS